MAESQSTSAAKQALQKLEDQLQCAICLDPYKDPKLLQCFHFFCKECLERLVVQDQQGQLSACCPTCRRSTLLPASGVSSLQSAFHIQHLFEIQEAFEKVKEASVESKISELAPQTEKVAHYCRLHNEKELELHCETCQELICVHCAVKLHNGHQHNLVSEVFEQHKDEITASLEPIETQLTSVNKALKRLDRRHEQITDQRAAIEAEIHETIQHLHQTLDARKTELIGQLDHMTQQKLKNLTAQRDEVEMIQIQLNSCLEFVRESLRTGSQAEIVNMKKPVVQQIKKMIANCNPMTMRPTELANLRFASKSVTEFKQVCQQFGRFFFHQISPSKCYATGNGLENALIGEKATVTLHTLDTEGVECDCPTESVSFVLASHRNTTEKTKCRIRPLKKSQYEISYQPATTRGRHQLHIKVDSEHIKGSPFTVMVKLPVQKLGTPIKTIGGLKGPCGVAVNKRGEIIVAECDGHRLSVLSPSGERLQTYCLHVSRRGQLTYPQGVAVDDDDNMLVVDSDNHCVQKFKSDAKLIKAVGQKGNKPLEFDWPHGIAIHPHNKKVYVADCNNQRIQILNPDLTFSDSFGNDSEDSGNGQLNIPWDVAVDNIGNVYVADSGNHTVQVFTADGEFLRKFGKEGPGDGELSWPYYLALDSDNVVYVTEGHNHRISVFTCEGQFLTSFGTKGNEPGQFNGPCGITVDKNGDVYVSDSTRMQIF